MFNPEISDGESFEELMALMPRIAEAVNAFNSEENQRVVLNLLVRAMGLRDDPPAAAQKASEPNLSVVPSPVGKPAEGADLGVVPNDSEQQPSGARQRRARKSGNKKWAPVQDIDFYPVGKPSLRDFVAEKQPGSFHEKNLVAVHYLEHVVAFRLSGWATCSPPMTSAGGSGPLTRITISGRRPASTGGWTRRT